ncbi:4-amino-4-deoxy-L-arabinose transferase [Rhizobiales bacterium GAS188]|nr:4-amino-4-deoxy-L-arabinose transferase [Rhizobiales bacterium GAS188]
MRIIILTMVLLGAPALALSTLANPLNDAGGIDAYLYLALIHDPTQILKRFGTTYYSNRIAFTLPNRLYLLALGDWHGYIAMRYTYLCAATASVYGIARSYYLSRIAIFSAILFCFNPWFIRSIMWDYVDGATITYLFVSLYLISTGGRYSIRYHALGGIVLAFAINCNTFALGVAACFGFPWLIIHLKAGARQCARMAAVFVIGLMIGYAVILSLQYMQAPWLGFWQERLTWAYALWSFNSAKPSWCVPLLRHLSFGNYYLLTVMPVLVAVIAAAAQPRLRSKIDLFGVAASAFLFIILFFFAIMQFVRHYPIITLFYYFDYALPAVTFALIALVGMISPRLRRVDDIVGYFAGIASILILWIAARHLRVVIDWIPLNIYALVIALSIGVAVVVRSRSWAWGGLVTFIIAVNSMFYYGPHGTNEYAKLHSSEMYESARDERRASLFLLDTVGRAVPPEDGKVGFWYGSDKEDSKFMSIQSIFFYEYSLVSLPPAHGMPHIDKNIRGRMMGYDYLVLLARDRGKIDAGLRALQDDGASIQEIKRETFHGHMLNYEMSIIRFKGPARCAIDPACLDI